MRFYLHYTVNRLMLLSNVGRKKFRAQFDCEEIPFPISSDAFLEFVL